MYSRIAITISFLFSLTACDQGSTISEINKAPARELTLAERYPGPWHEDFNVDISRALASKGIRGCGQFKYKASSKNTGEYVVYCTCDGTDWNSYLVWPRIDGVTGPHQTDPSLD